MSNWIKEFDKWYEHPLSGPSGAKRIIRKALAKTRKEAVEEENGKRNRKLKKGEGWCKELKQTNEQDS